MIIRYYDDDRKKLLSRDHDNRKEYKTIKGMKERT
jgi:hypothetical protein